ncbi:hypothetical protein DPX16_2230 [Anabarilius grahami]|uniref:Uncharacterized protein n=1 Tax=Anabarilius grahami TaxID=495550 RepID=A0A3N0YRQ9_ANAGA|nr:hypothetical protein DPX16_2230 [Anabarilius grahami]
MDLKEVTSIIDSRCAKRAPVSNGMITWLQIMMQLPSGHTPSQVWVSLRISRSRWHNGMERETTTGHLQIGGPDGSGYVEEHLLLGPSMNGGPS